MVHTKLLVLMNDPFCWDGDWTGSILPKSRLSVSLAQPSLPAKTHQLPAEAKSTPAFIYLSVCDKSTNLTFDLPSIHWSDVTQILNLS